MHYESIEKSNILTHIQKSLLVLWGRLGKGKANYSGAVQKVIYVMSSKARHLSINMKRPLASLEVTAFF